MTKKEFFEKVIALVDDEEIKAHAEHEIKLINIKNDRRKNTISEKAKENAPIKKSIVDFLAGKDFTLCSEIAQAVNISTQKCTYLCKQLIDDRIIVDTDIKVKSKGTRKGYKLR